MAITRAFTTGDTEGTEDDKELNLYREFAPITLFPG